jgi:hypothetical protein
VRFQNQPDLVMIATVSPLMCENERADLALSDYQSQGQASESEHSDNFESKDLSNNAPMVLNSSIFLYNFLVPGAQRLAQRRKPAFVTHDNKASMCVQIVGFEESLNHGNKVPHCTPVQATGSTCR